MRLDGFRLQLFVLTVLPLSGFLLILAFGGTRVHSRTMRLLVAERDARTVRVAAEVIAERMRYRQALLASVAGRLGGGEALGAAEAVASLPEPQGVAVLNNVGQLLAGSLNVQTPLPDLAGRLSVSPSVPLLLERGTGTEPEVVVLAGSAAGVTVVAAYDLNVFLPGLAASQGEFDRDLRLYLVDRSGRTASLLGAGPLERAVTDHPGVKAGLGGESGFAYASTPGGEHVIAYASVPLAGWALILEEPWETVTSPLLDISMAAPLALAPALVVALIGLWFGARSVILPLRELERQARRVSSGDTVMTFPILRGIGEIRQLQRTLSVMAARVTAANRALRAYIGRITEAQEEERQRIARELHDETVQQLIALDQRLQILDADLQERGHLERGRIAELREAAGRTTRGIRALSRGLRPDYLQDLGLSAALGVLAGETQATYGVPTAFEAEGTAYRLSPEAELAVYRVAQEALSNIGRHASATHAQVRLIFAAGELRLSVLDDGSGLDLPVDFEELGKRGHWGLIGMRERAVSVGGRLDVVSAPGRETGVELSVPARNE